MRPILTSFVVAMLLSCGGSTDNNEQPKPQCSDGVDNDEDGAIDFPEDPGCASETGLNEGDTPAPACSDGRDNDDDGLTDYPSDPGCYAPNQDDEDDDCPDGPNCPECGNHQDDDMNGSTDYPDDPGCTAAGDVTEVENNPVACGAGLVIHPLPSSNMLEATLDGTSVSSVSSPCGGGAGAPADAYQLYLPKPKVVVVSTDDANTTADTVIDIRSAECSTASAEVACNDNIPGTTAKRSKVTVSLPAGLYYIIVGAHDSTTGGEYALKVELFAGEGSMCSQTPECGPGLVCRVPLNGSGMSCQQPVCRDGIDDDGDGKNDYPNDPGCAAPDDNDEADGCPGVGPTCPACGDGADNDADTLTDFPADFACAAASGTNESFCPTETSPTAVLTTAVTTGTTVGKTNDFATQTCQTTATGPDIVYALVLPVPVAQLRLDTETSPFDTVLSVRDGVCGVSIGCDDDGGAGTQSILTMTNLAAGAYAVIVDGYNAASGTFTLTVRGTVAAQTECSSPLFTGGTNAILACPTGTTCTGTPAKCQ